MTRTAIDNTGKQVEVDDDVIVNVIDGVNYLLTADEVAAFEKAETDFQAELPSIHLANLRKRRDELLLASDWTQNRDVNLSNDDEWQAYRRALRDLPTSPDPANPTWPKEPSK